MYDNRIILIGYSEHGLVGADTALDNKLNIIGYFEKVRCISNPFNFEFLGNESDLDIVGWDFDIEFLIGIWDNFIWDKISKFVSSKSKRVYTLIHTTSTVSRFCEMANGVLANKNVSKKCS